MDNDDYSSKVMLAFFVVFVLLKWQMFLFAVLHLKDRSNKLFSYNTLCTWMQTCLIFILERFQIGPVCCFFCRVISG